MAAQSDHTRYRKRIAHMLASPPIFGGEASSSIEGQAQWAKYVCVLVSGFIEQAMKEILISYSSRKSAPAVHRYIEKTWPSSKNMNVGAIAEILGKFDQSWEVSFLDWLNASIERKATINNIITWRNNIAHGNESNTTGVTMSSVKNGFSCACKLVEFVEELVSS